MTDTQPAVPEPDDLDAAYAAVRRDPYPFTWSGEHWQLPHLADLDYRLQMRIETAEQLGADELTALFDDMFGKEQAARWATVEVPTGALFLLFERWLAHSGAKLGEDKASNDSSEITGRSSRRTSGVSTDSGSPKRSTAKKAAKRTPRKAVSPPVNSST